MTVWHVQNTENGNTVIFWVRCEFLLREICRDLEFLRNVLLVQLFENDSAVIFDRKCIVKRGPLEIRNNLLEIVSSY